MDIYYIYNQYTIYIYIYNPNNFEVSGYTLRKFCQRCTQNYFPAILKTILLNSYDYQNKIKSMFYERTMKTEH